MVKVLPVPALASRTVTPGRAAARTRRSRPRLRLGRGSAGSAASPVAHLLGGQQAAPQPQGVPAEAGRSRRRPSRRPPRPGRRRGRADRRRDATPPRTSWCSGSRFSPMPKSFCGSHAAGRPVIALRPAAVSAQAADVLQYKGSGSHRPRSKRSTSTSRWARAAACRAAASPASGAEAGDADRSLLAAGEAEPADGGRLHRTVGVGGGEGQEPDPGGQPVLGREAGVAHRPEQQTGRAPVDHAGDGAEQHPPVGQRDVDLQRPGAPRRLPGDVGRLGHQALDDGQHLAQHRLGQRAGREACPGPVRRPRRRRGRRRPGGRRGAGRRPPTAPARRARREGPREASSASSLRETPSRWRRNALTGCCTNRTRCSSSTASACTGGSGRRQERRRLRPLAAGRPGAGQGDGVEAPGRRPGQPAGHEVAGVERLQGMVDDDPARGPAPLRSGRRAGGRCGRRRRAARRPGRPAGRSALVRSSRPL